VTVVIDMPQRIGRAFELIDELTGDQSLVTSEMVPVFRTMRDEAG